MTNFLDVIARDTIPDLIFILDDMGNTVAAGSDVRPDIAPRGPFFQNSAPDGDGLTGFKHDVFGVGVFHACSIPHPWHVSTHYAAKNRK